MEPHLEPTISSEGEHKLTLSSQVKWKIQNQLMEYLMDYLVADDEGAQGENGKVDIRSESSNRYMFFIVERLSEEIGYWFESLCRTDDIANDEDRSHLLTVEEFEAAYSNNPKKVLAEVLARVRGTGPQDVDEYLRELKEWFKVNPPSDSEKSKKHDRLAVSIEAHLTKGSVRKVMDGRNDTEAESA